MATASEDAEGEHCCTGNSTAQFQIAHFEPKHGREFSRPHVASLPLSQQSLGHATLHMYFKLSGRIPLQPEVCMN